jgi:hypothetical protein
MSGYVSLGQVRSRYMRLVQVKICHVRLSLVSSC